jgi:hypothetical protein
MALPPDGRCLRCGWQLGTPTSLQGPWWVCGRCKTTGPNPQPKFCPNCGNPLEGNGALAANHGTNGAALRTILLGIVLAILVVPFGGVVTVPALLVIAALVIFDLWRQQQRMEAIRAGVPQPTEAEIEARQARRRRIGLLVLGALILSLVIAYFAFSGGR